MENGLILCQKHHEQKTNSEIQIQYEWLDEDQVAWLAEVGWVAWDDDGEPYGRGMRHFAPRKVA